jgi:CPA2 family monovalent cation:H+ antiporter-2
MEIPLLKDLLLIYALAVAILFVCHRIRIASIVGFLFTGILVGPYGFGLISAQEEVEILAEIGVVLLLFTIGIEFSLQNLLRIKKSVFVGGTLQVFLTIAIAFLIAKQIGVARGQAAFIGLLVSSAARPLCSGYFRREARLKALRVKHRSPFSSFRILLLFP